MNDCTPDKCDCPKVADRPTILEIHSNAPVVRTRLSAILVGVGVGMAAVIGLAICAGILAGLGAGSPVAWLLAAILGVAILAGSFWIRHRRWCNEYSTAIGALAGPFDSVVTQAVEMLRYRNVNHGLSMLGFELVSRGTLGVTIRIAAESKRVPINPLHMPVEPFSLDESSEGFLQLALTGSEQAGQAAAKNLERHEDSRRLRRMMPQAFVFLVFLVIAGSDIRSWLLYGSWDIKDAIMLAVIGLYAIPAIWQFDAGRLRLLALNGGILYRPRWPRTDPHLFTRDRSVLILYPDNQLQWHWIVCDESYPSGLDMLCTTSEAEMLLRAWLSPLPPPKIERLTDFS